jgi:hypothetical protein
MAIQFHLFVKLEVPHRIAFWILILKTLQSLME